MCICQHKSSIMLNGYTNRIIQWMIYIFLMMLCMSSAAFAEDVLTLEKAYALARANSPQIIAQQYAVEAAEAQASEAKYYWTPKFEFKSIYMVLAPKK